MASIALRGKELGNGLRNREVLFIINRRRGQKKRKKKERKLA